MITRALNGACLLIYGMLYDSILAADFVNFNCLARVAPCCPEMFHWCDRDRPVKVVGCVSGYLRIDKRCSCFAGFYVEVCYCRPSSGFAELRAWYRAVLWFERLKIFVYGQSRPCEQLHVCNQHIVFWIVVS